MAMLVSFYVFDVEYTESIAAGMVSLACVDKQDNASVQLRDCPTTIRKGR
jgi:hypothetical protein